jgi:hypothetical protein
MDSRIGRCCSHTGAQSLTLSTRLVRLFSSYCWNQVNVLKAESSFLVVPLELATAQCGRRMERSSVSSSMSSWVFCEQQYVELSLLWAAICWIGFCEQQYVELSLLWAAISRAKSSVSSNMSSWVFCEQQYAELSLLWAAICWIGFCEQQYVELSLLWAAISRAKSSVSSNMSSWVFCEQQYVD